MVVTPPLTPVSTPKPEIAPMPGALLLQVPPPAGSVNVMNDPTHTFDGPVTVPAEGAVFTVTVAETVQVPIA